MEEPEARTAARKCLSPVTVQRPNDQPLPTECNMLIYADDLCITTRQSDFQHVEHTLELALDEMSIYYSRNHLKPNPAKTQICCFHLIPPSHRRRGATAVLVRHKPQWHRHDSRGSAGVPSLIVVAPRKTVKTADLRGGTAATLNMFRRASAVLFPSHRRRGATAVLVRHKPQCHRHDRRGSAVVPSLIAVAPWKPVKTEDLRGGTAETLNMFKTSAVPLRVEPIRSGIAAAPP